MNKVFYSLFFLLYLLPGQAQRNLLPSPQIFIKGKGNYQSPKKTIEDLTIKITFTDSIREAKLNTNEAYKLKIQENTISITAKTEDGIYWAKQTLKQLIKKQQNGSLSIPCCEIIDWPAFAFRGFMHDTGRSYISIKELKKEIALLSHFKINTFHWHLTEDIAWRIESKKYPQLNQRKNMKRDREKYYTQQEIKDFLKFCKQHHVLVIPEIDMPGHSAAFTRTFETSMQSEKGINILKQLLTEICEIFDVPYLHIGTDEVKFSNSTFVPEIVHFLREKGKKVVSWNPGWKYTKNEIDMLQLWSYKGKTKKGIPAIDSRYHYLNHFDTFGDIIALYNSKIGNAIDSREDIKGAIVAVWNDRQLENERQIILQNNFYPNMLALAERTWMGGGIEYFNDEGSTMRSTSSEAYKNFADFEKRMLWHKKNILKSEPFAYTKQTHVEWNVTEAFPNNGNVNKKFPPEKQLDSIYTYQNKTYKVHPAYGASVYLRHTWGELVPSFYKKPKENHTAYAYTWVYAPQQQKAGLWIEFQNYSRSEKDLAPLPRCWDYRGSKIWLNDKEIIAPIWKNTHTEKNSEISLKDENLTSRKPIPVILQKGWNKIFIKLPVQRFTSSEVRLQKWMFTAIFVNIKNRESLHNIKYSRNKQLK